MKKTLLVSAIALAVSGQAMAGQSAVDGLYGKIRLGLDSQSSDNVAKDNDSLDLVSGKLVFGFKGEEDLGNGMTIGYGIEFEHDGADKEQARNSGTPATGAATDDNSGITNDKSWVSLGGSWGKVIVGEYGDFAFNGAANGVGVGQYGTTWSASNVHNTSPANTVQYRGNAGAVNFGIGLVQDGGKDTSSTLLGLGYAGSNFQVGVQVVDAELNDPLNAGTVANETGVLIGGSYTFGDITIGVANGDNGSATDSGVTDVALRMPLLGGSFLIRQSLFDVDDRDETLLDFQKGLGNTGYWGLHYRTKDEGPSVSTDHAIAFVGVNF
jgi:predicted porin